MEGLTGLSGDLLVLLAGSSGWPADGTERLAC